MPISEPTDEDLIDLYRATADSERGLECIDQLFRRHHHRVAAWCLRMAADREAAADLAQEVFMKAFRNLATFEGKARFTTWLYTITRNHCLNVLQSRSRRPEQVGQEAADSIQDPRSEDWAERLHREMDSRALLEFLGRTLDEIEERVMMLHYGQDFPLDAVTRLLRLENPSGAKAYVVSARRKIDRALIRYRARLKRVGHANESNGRDGRRGKGKENNLSGKRGK